MSSNNDPILREIDEEVRRDEIAKLIKLYTPFIIGAVVLIIAVVGGMQGYKFWQEKKYLQRAELWEAAIAKSAPSREEEIKAMAEFAEKAEGGYRALALLRKAKAEQSLDKNEDALKTYLALAADEKIEKEFRELGLLIGAYVALDSGKAAEVSAQVEAAANKGDAVYPGLLREWLALNATASGDKAAAAKIFAELSEDATAPKQLQQRAAEMAHAASLASGGAK